MNDILLRHVGEPDYATLPGYRRTGGYEALRMAIDRSPEMLVEEVIRSGLRGRGGGGYPTGLKWEQVLKAPGGGRVVVCNAAEGEPGSLKDRYLLRIAPHQVLEGIWIAARAVKAAKAYLFIKQEFTRELTVVKRALEECRDARSASGLTTNPEEIEIIEGPDQYLAGEETALLEVMEGRPPVPRQKPPYYPAYYGFQGKPTVINNVETLANVPAIIREGASWFSGFGTAESPGTMLFTLSGDVNRPGVYELPMGTPMRKLIWDLGGGILGGSAEPSEKNAVKAVFPGGPSSAVLTVSQLDTPLSFEALRKAGSTLGAGAVRVLSQQRCMVREAVRHAIFFRDGSCGQCPACHMGTHNLSVVLERVQKGEGHSGDLNSLAELCRFMPGRGSCGLITGAALCVGSLLANFRDEFESHARGEPCPFRD